MLRNIARHALMQASRRPLTLKPIIPLVRTRAIQPLIRPFHFTSMSWNQQYHIT